MRRRRVGNEKEGAHACTDSLQMDQAFLLCTRGIRGKRQEREQTTACQAQGEENARGDGMSEMRGGQAHSCTDSVHALGRRGSNVSPLHQRDLGHWVCIFVKVTGLVRAVSARPYWSTLKKNGLIWSNQSSANPSSSLDLIRFRVKF